MFSIAIRMDGPRQSQIILGAIWRVHQGFAEGALLATRWVVGKKGLFTFEEVMK